jgi:hypothetical protein
VGVAVFAEAEDNSRACTKNILKREREEENREITTCNSFSSSLSPRTPQRKERKE